MKFTRHTILLLVLIPFSFAFAAREKSVLYTINMNGPSTDTFEITINVKDLKPENNVYQFASTAPGTYEVMNLGRFVSHFKAFDKKGNEVSAKQVSVNQWELSKPENVRKIIYRMSETWDIPVKENTIYRMCGTSLEKDHALLNAHCLFGFFKGMQDADIKLKLEYPMGWEVGTVLKKNSKGYYLSPDYDFSVDSPILLGRLSKAALDLAGKKVEIYTYSKTDMVKSEDLMKNMEVMLKAANAFLVTLPVDRYVFLYHFEDISNGAWEHSYSSEYVYKEAPLTPKFSQKITSIAAHEFFHVVTPLNIHSEIIQEFNFVTPTPSEHLWLYEGTTEWASDIMQVRYGTMDLEQYLNEIQEKLNQDDKFDKSYSLSKLSLTSYTPEGNEQYNNIYSKGAVVAALLDIRLLELSGGKKGLRELILDLAKTYGPHKSFPEKDFFNIVIAKTYPEIGDFINKYIKGVEVLPIKEYFGKLGIEYISEFKTGKKVPDLGFDLTVLNGKIVTKDVGPKLKDQGVKEQEEILFIDDVAFTIANFSNIQQKIKSLKVETPFTLTVNREDKPLAIKTEVFGKDEIIKHQLKSMQSPTPEQLLLRGQWMKNLN